MTQQRFCTSCGAGIRDTAKFCHRCGHPTDGSARPASNLPAGNALTASNALPWAVAGIALLCLLAFIVGQNLGRAPAATAAAAAPVAAQNGRAPDISQMGPEERADRLFQKVMTLVSEGKSDSVAFFSPMAIQSQLALAPLDDHRRYDLGLLAMVSGDAPMARAQADTILAKDPDHLLGLILAMRAAGMTADATARARFAKHFVDVVDRERLKRLPEYSEHDPDISAAVREASSPP